MRLQVPGLIEYGVMAGLDDTRGQVKIHNVLVRRCIIRKDPCEVMVIQFAATGARHLHPYLQAKCLEVRNVRPPAVPTLIGGFVGSRVHKAVVQVHQVEKRRRQEFFMEPGAI